MDDQTRFCSYKTTIFVFAYHLDCNYCFQPLVRPKPSLEKKDLLNIPFSLLKVTPVMTSFFSSISSSSRKHPLTIHPLKGKYKLGEDLYQTVIMLQIHTDACLNSMSCSTQRQKILYGTITAHISPLAAPPREQSQEKGTGCPAALELWVSV